MAGVVLASLATGIIRWMMPSALITDFLVLVLCYSGMVVWLWGGRQLTTPRLSALYAVAGLVLTSALSVPLLRLHTGPMSARSWLAQVSIVITLNGVLLLPGLVKRWLAWREHSVLAEQARQHAIERTLLQARLAALQGQIEPHFLFNTLANVRYLVERDSAKANTMLAHLIDYLRATLPELRQGEATLGQEVARVKAYLDIMQIRMGERLQYHIDVPDELSPLPVPPLSLATLVENALKHGIEPKQGAGEINIQASRQGNVLHILIEDDGAGFSETGGEGGVGLSNLQARLHGLYRGKALLELSARPTGGVCARIEIPVE
ncbi:sensor histidine kinase [Burkholderiaceae bacterium DAT-1]|nr:sensor histidine kinase [Burkholderiaceae bacterium DAT-1]